MNLLQSGDFRLSSGQHSLIKIDCDALTEDDWQTLAFMAAMILPPFKKVVPVPRGGIPFARKLETFARPDQDDFPVLVAEDVVTSGASLMKVMIQHPGSIGICAFNRGPLPERVKSVMTLNVPV